MIKHMVLGAALVTIAASPVLASDPIRPSTTNVIGKKLALRKGARAGAKTNGASALGAEEVAVAVVGGGALVAGIVAAADGGGSN